MFNSLLCCCGGNNARRRQGTHDLLENSHDHLGDDDLLLPGELQWDKQTKSFVQKNHKPAPGTTTTAGQYVPPTIPSCTEPTSDSIRRSRNIPTIEDFRLIKTVGKGAFGKVVMAVHCSSHTLYVIKAVPKTRVSTPKLIRQIVAEIQILKKVKHRFCVSLQYAFQNSHCLFYVFEFAAGGMLFYHLREEGRFNETKARFYIGEIILAVEYLHSFGVIFRDLKPENCMLSALGHILLTDFGSAKQLTGAEKTATLAGTPHYMAPEVLRGEPYSYSADWWSTGVILYEMLVGKTPFNSSDRLELYRTILKCSFKIPTFISLRAQSLLHKLIERTAELRLGYTNNPQHTGSGTEIKEHGFFNTHPLSEEEEVMYRLEEGDRERAASSKRNRQESLTSSITRRLSIKSLRVMKPEGCPCEWHWKDLADGDVYPPFIPDLMSPTDCSYFDPILTSVPPTINDLMSTGSISASTPKEITIEAFNYNGVDNYQPSPEPGLESPPGATVSSKHHPMDATL